MRLGDVITAVDGKKIESPNELFTLLENYKVGDVVNISLLRDGKKLSDKGNPGGGSIVARLLKSLDCAQDAHGERRRTIDRLAPTYRLSTPPPSPS